MIYNPLGDISFQKIFIACRLKLDYLIFYQSAMTSKVLSTLFVLIFLSYSGFSQIVINEYSASNLNDYPDNFSKYEDWIELYNASNDAVNLKGWHLSDKQDKITKWEFRQDVMINPGGHLVVWCSGRDSIYNSGIHTNFKLTQTKGNEVLVLSTPDEILINSIPMEITQLGHSRARLTDSSSEWMVSVEPTLNFSNEGAEMYKAYADEVALSLEAGFYQGKQEVTISDTPENSNIHYTVDGTEPTQSDPIYEDGTEIDIQLTTVLKAKVFSTDPEVLPSKIAFNTYFVNESFTVPVFSVAADGIQDLANGNGVLRPQGTLEYFEDGERLAASYGELNRHGQDSWILPHRSLDWISRDEMGYNKAVKAKLFNYSERDEYQRFMFRASGDDNYPANGDNNHEGSCHIRDEYVHALAHNGNMKLDVRAVERVVVFLDGKYWGLYGLRERPADHDYTAEYYDQGKYDLHYLATWGGTWAEYGGNNAFQDWGEFRDFVLDNDMSGEVNYEIVKSQFQVKSLCDYMIINLNTVASDWLNYNTGWWRGTNPEGDHKKWGYILWDNDATFDYYINYSGVPNTDPDAQPCDIEDISDYMDDFFGNGDVGKHEKIFLKLLEENDEFRQLYYSRQADMINTVFSCENMVATFDSMIATITPEMPRQIDRWGGSMAEWEANVADMKDFIEERCTSISGGMVDCYSLTGPFNVTLNVEPEGAGQIEYNTLDITTFPWSGEYFGVMPNLIKAIALDEKEPFLFWKTENGSLINPDSTLAEAELYIETEESLTAVFGEIVGTTETLGSSSVSVYPTVTTSIVNVLASFDVATGMKLDVLDMKGRVVQQFNTPQNVQQGEYHWSINIDSQAAGMYIVRLTTQDGIVTSKVIKQ